MDRQPEQESSATGSKRKRTDELKTPALRRSKRTSNPLVSPELEQQPTDVTKHKWEAGMRVWVRLYSKDWVEGEVVGTVEHVHFDGKPYDYAIRVYVKDEHGNSVIPSTWHKQPYEIPKGETKAHLRSYDEFQESLPDPQKTAYRVLKYNEQKAAGSGVDTDDLSELDKLLLFGGNRKPDYSLNAQVLDILRSPDAMTAVQLATGHSGQEGMTVINALAFLLGQLAGCELQNLGSSRDKEQQQAGKWVLDGFVNDSNPNLEEFQGMDCDILKVFLTSVMLTRTKKGNGFDPTRALFDVKGKEVLSDQKSLEKRLSPLTTSLMCLHSAQYCETQLSGPASGAVLVGLNLLLDMKGISDKLIKRLCEKGITSSIRILRQFLTRAASSIDSSEFRAPLPDGRIPYVLLTTDNADFRLFSRVISVIPIGDILLGYEDPEDTKRLNSNYIDGLPLPSEDMAKRMAPTKDDDVAAKKVIRLQNIFALLNAAIHKDDPFLNGKTIASFSDDFAILERFIDTHGEEEFYKAVHTLMADQEFMPTFYRSFFSSLVTDDKIPLILMLAMGHGMKSVSVSMMTYYSSIFDPIFKAQGIPVGTPVYNRLRKGRVIRETVRWVVDTLESLRLSLANKYFIVRGNSKVLLDDNSKVLKSPNQVVMEYLAMFDSDSADQCVQSCGSSTRQVWS